jgi:YVTN family beta-propeller protein
LTVADTSGSDPTGLPGGTVTFVFTDIEGSTRLERELRERYGGVLAEHARLLREAFTRYGGHEVDTQGDSFFFVFARARAAVAAAVDGQRELAAHDWPPGAEVRVRVGIHTGEAEPTDGRYVGLAVHRAARISAAGHGGQILLSSSTRDLVEDDLPADQGLVDLGEHNLKDLPRRERIFQLIAEGLPREFPPLKTAEDQQLAQTAEAVLAPRWRRRPERRVFIAATFAAALVGVAAGVLLTQGGGSSAQASVSPNAVGVIRADSGDIATEAPVGESPAEIAAGEGAVWVTNAGDNTVSRIDPSSNEVVETIDVGNAPAGVAVGEGAVWVANGLDGTVSRINPEENEVVQTITVGNGPNGVAFGEGAVWVTNSADGTVSRIAPGPGPARMTRTYPAALGAAGIAVGGGRIWIASPTSATVVALDPASGRVVERVGVGAEPDALAFGDGALWVANRAGDTVSKISPEAAAVVDTVEVGRGPEGIVASQDAVWVANGRDRTVSRIEPGSGTVVDTVLLENPPRGVALTDEGLYAAVRSTGDEHRGGELRVQALREPDFIDPALAYHSSSWSILTITNDGLVGYRKVRGVEGTQLVPNLALALPSPTDGGKTYTFEIRRGIEYSDGTPVRPADFRRAVERAFELGSPGTGYYASIVGASGCKKGKRCDLARGIATDDAARTVTFRLTAPDADFLLKLALPFVVAVPDATRPRAIGTQPLPATGPYRITTFDRKRKTLRLVRNPRFREWSADAQPQGFPDSMVFSWSVPFEDQARRTRQVERGEADIAMSGGPPLPDEEAERLSVTHGRRLHVTPELSTIYFFLNTRLPPFDNKRAREAVAAAWDREDVAQLVGHDGTPTCRILPRNFPGYRPSCPRAAGGVEGLDRGRRLVRRSGTAGTRVTVWVPSPLPLEEGRYVVSLLNSLGYRARLRRAGLPDEYFPKVADPRTRAQIGFGGWALDYPSAADFITPLLSCAGYTPTTPERTSNLTAFCDPAIDAKMARAAATAVHDPAAAIALWQEIEDELLAHAPLVPAYNRNYVTLVSERVGNYQYNPQWGPLLSQLWVR